VEAKSFVSVQLKYLATCALAALFLAFASGALQESTSTKKSRRASSIFRTH